MKAGSSSSPLLPWPVLLVVACTAPRASAPVPAAAEPRRLESVAPAPERPVRPALACTRPASGPAPLRRLTREQYINTVADLLADAGVSADAVGGLRGVSVVASTTLPADETVGAFRSNLVAAPTELDAQQLMEAAERAGEVAAQRADRLLACDDGGAQPAEACARRFVERFGRRALRRPLRPDEQERYLRLLGETMRAEGPREAVRALVRTLLQSPYFVHHTYEDGPVLADGLRALGPYALASRLSYYLWVSGPDEALLEAAASGALATPEGLRAQAERMLRDPRARRSLASFHLQWLGIEDVGSVPKSGKIFPLWYRDRRGATASPLGTALRVETERFVDHVVRQGDGKLQTLLTASFSFLEDPLFEYYGVERPADADPARPVALDPRQRAGLLTHGSVLAAHAHAGQSSPVSRGLLVRKSLLCQDLPDPPPNVNSNPPDPDPKLTTRERFEEHRLDVGCGGCHKLIDPVGFAFEHYDAIGRYRETENGLPIDASGTFHDAGSLDGDFTGALELADRLARSPEVRSCYVRQWFRFALGRMETPADACSLQALEQAFAAAGDDVRALLLTLPTTDSFRLRAAGPASAAAALHTR